MASDERPKATIECSPNGPYLVSNLATLSNAKGEALPTRPRMALCRCGGSSNKPFCDGTHARNGFSSARLRAEPPTTARDEYRGQGITIFDNRTVCAHAGYCTARLPAVWRMGVEPWIAPDAAAAGAIIETVRSCPSGALSYALGDVAPPDPEREPMITVSKDGPYHVVGGPELVDPVTGQRPQSREHYALCRCGHSKNKPFCDGTHWHVGFRDDAGSE